ncbi:MAG: BadF/BadG/BcrA/BcrD ATPase family protein [Pararhodobacter sp.]
MPALFDGPSPTTWLGIDMGGTGTRWVLRGAGGAVLARGEGPGATGLVFSATAEAAFRAALAPAAEAVARFGAAAAVLGVTGAGLDPDAALVALCAEALGLPAARVRVLNDMVLAWHAAFPAGGGHLVAAGTGSVGMSIAEDGTITLVGGRGTLIDDAGSGAWLALRALDRVWRAIDEAGSPRGVEPLAQALFSRIGGDDWDDTRRYVYGRDRGALAALAPAVAEAATAGSAVALHLLTEAGAELARLARVLVARCGPAPVGVVGGVLGLHPAVGEAMRAAAPGISLTVLSLDAAARAAELAQEGTRTA